MLTPIALRLLVIRHTAQQAGDIPATDVVSQNAIQVSPFWRNGIAASPLLKKCGTLLRALDRKSDGPLVGRPYGKDGCALWMSWRAFILPRIHPS
ncbi:hypothetical protein [Ktedonospora formicarum]|uniref:hypothetical protein n=1 Tax=Ktedonospora formicarum TaxID=2778364 RepID=UPI001C68C8BB|nr:hypothetical protein [Ktedonospora formicarum]